MLGDIVGEMKTKFATMLRAALWGAVAGGAGLASILFLLIALFVWTSDHYDAVTACVTLAIVLALIAGIATTLFVMVQRQKDARNKKQRVNAKPVWLDPVIVATGLDVVRILGGRRATMLALGALATTWLLTVAPSESTSSRRPRSGT